MSEKKSKANELSRKERKLQSAKVEKKKQQASSGKKKPGVKRRDLPAKERNSEQPVVSSTEQPKTNEVAEKPKASEAPRKERSTRTEAATRSRTSQAPKAKSSSSSERISPSERYEQRQKERATTAAKASSIQPKMKRPKSASGKPYAAASQNALSASTNMASRGRSQDVAAQTSSPADAEQVKVGDVIIVTIKRIGINGEGVGYFRRKAVFIDGAITNEVVKAEVLETQAKFIKAQLIEIEKKSKHRVEPPCPVYGICGGCQLQHISYEGQLIAKLEIVREAFSRYSGLNDLKIKPTLGMDRPWDYRNKAQLQVERRDVKGAKSEIIAGLYEIGSHEIVDISGCPIQHPQVNRAVDKVKNVLAELNIPLSKGDSRGGRSDIKDSGQRKGVRTIVVRNGFQSGEIQVTLVTETADLPRQEDLVERLRLELPEMSGLSINVNPFKTPLIFGERTISLWGTEAMNESLGDLNFTLSPRAFFQLNPEQTIKLYETVKAGAALTGKEMVVDAYCGTGTIGLWLAPYAAEVRGIEVIPEAAEDAQRNAERNERSNAQFFAGEAEDLLPRWAKEGLSPDVIVADPPRVGLDRKFLDTVLRTKPSKFVYVSCNPSTLAKDCKVLLDGGYEIQSVQPIDMFPQTSQVECVTVLVRK
ncbi:23S rRNA (uracil(1939)-C(5))-methyltransferase RlmD [Saccharibacillus sp. JS10]|uniref:23S rRNA (uracil(1939)-C(5))-methyltransferase RlmD n=1 Tax=Saccharibacillus sp. JS10 TaxID=2950552 RepID=UPI0035208709